MRILAPMLLLPVPHLLHLLLSFLLLLVSCSWTEQAQLVTKRESSWTDKIGHARTRTNLPETRVTAPLSSVIETPSWSPSTPPPSPKPVRHVTRGGDTPLPSQSWQTASSLKSTASPSSFPEVLGSSIAANSFTRITSFSSVSSRVFPPSRSLSSFQSSSSSGSPPPSIFPLTSPSTSLSPHFSSYSSLSPSISRPHVPGTSFIKSAASDDAKSPDTETAKLLESGDGSVDAEDDGENKEKGNYDGEGGSYEGREVDKNDRFQERERYERDSKVGYGGDAEFRPKKSKEPIRLDIEGGHGPMRQSIQDQPQLSDTDDVNRSSSGDEIPEESLKRGRKVDSKFPEEDIDGFRRHRRKDLKDNQEGHSKLLNSSTSRQRGLIVGKRRTQHLVDIKNLTFKNASIVAPREEGEDEEEDHEGPGIDLKPSMSKLHSGTERAERVHAIEGKWHLLKASAKQKEWKRISWGLVSEKDEGNKVLGKDLGRSDGELSVKSEEGNRIKATHVNGNERTGSERGVRKEWELDNIHLGEPEVSGSVYTFKDESEGIDSASVGPKRASVLEKARRGESELNAEFVKVHHNEQEVSVDVSPAAGKTRDHLRSSHTMSEVPTRENGAGHTAKGALHQDVLTDASSETRCDFSSGTSDLNRDRAQLPPPLPSFHPLLSLSHNFSISSHSSNAMGKRRSGGFNEAYKRHGESIPQFFSRMGRSRLGRRETSRSGSDHFNGLADRSSTESSITGSPVKAQNNELLVRSSVLTGKNKRTSPRSPFNEIGKRFSTPSPLSNGKNIGRGSSRGVNSRGPSPSGSLVNRNGKTISAPGSSINHDNRGSNSLVCPECIPSHILPSPLPVQVKSFVSSSSSSKRPPEGRISFVEQNKRTNTVPPYVPSGLKSTRKNSVNFSNYEFLLAPGTSPVSPDALGQRADKGTMPSSTSASKTSKVKENKHVDKDFTEHSGTFTKMGHKSRVWPKVIKDSKNLLSVSESKVNSNNSDAGVGNGTFHDPSRTMTKTFHGPSKAMTNSSGLSSRSLEASQEVKNAHLGASVSSEDRQPFNNLSGDTYVLNLRVDQGTSSWNQRVDQEASESDPNVSQKTRLIPGSKQETNDLNDRLGQKTNDVNRRIYEKKNTYNQRAEQKTNVPDQSVLRTAFHHPSGVREYPDLTNRVLSLEVSSVEPPNVMAVQGNNVNAITHQRDPGFLDPDALPRLNSVIPGEGAQGIRRNQDIFHEFLSPTPTPFSPSPISRSSSVRVENEKTLKGLNRENVIFAGNKKSNFDVDRLHLKPYFLKPHDTTKTLGTSVKSSKDIKQEGEFLGNGEEENIFPTRLDPVSAGTRDYFIKVQRKYKQISKTDKSLSTKVGQLDKLERPDSPGQILQKGLQNTIIMDQITNPKTYNKNILNEPELQEIILGKAKFDTGVQKSRNFLTSGKNIDTQVDHRNHSKLKVHQRPETNLKLVTPQATPSRPRRFQKVVRVLASRLCPEVLQAEQDLLEENISSLSDVLLREPGKTHPGGSQRDSISEPSEIEDSLVRRNLRRDKRKNRLGRKAQSDRVKTRRVSNTECILDHSNGVKLQELTVNSDAPLPLGSVIKTRREKPQTPNSNSSRLISGPALAVASNSPQDYRSESRRQGNGITATKRERRQVTTKGNKEREQGEQTPVYSKTPTTLTESRTVSQNGHGKINSDSSGNSRTQGYENVSKPSRMVRNPPFTEKRTYSERLKEAERSIGRDSDESKGRVRTEPKNAEASSTLPQQETNQKLFERLRTTNRMIWSQKLPVQLNGGEKLSSALENNTPKPLEGKGNPRPSSGERGWFVKNMGTEYGSMEEVLGGYESMERMEEAGGWNGVKQGYFVHEEVKENDGGRSRLRENAFTVEDEESEVEPCNISNGRGKGSLDESGGGEDGGADRGDEASLLGGETSGGRVEGDEDPEEVDNLISEDEVKRLNVGSGRRESKENGKVKGKGGSADERNSRNGDQVDTKSGERRLGGNEYVDNENIGAHVYTNPSLKVDSGKSNRPIGYRDKIHKREINGGEVYRDKVYEVKEYKETIQLQDISPEVGDSLTESTKSVEVLQASTRETLPTNSSVHGGGDQVDRSEIDSLCTGDVDGCSDDASLQGQRGQVRGEGRNGSYSEDSDEGVSVVTEKGLESGGEEKDEEREGGGVDVIKIWPKEVESETRDESQIEKELRGVTTVEGKLLNVTTMENKLRETNQLENEFRNASKIEKEVDDVIRIVENIENEESLSKAREQVDPHSRFLVQEDDEEGEAGGREGGRYDTNGTHWKTPHRRRHKRRLSKRRGKSRD
ncbi:uncharacterized protein LOC143027569 [Oratosquilla oratoria]|uniref:uncharacterized protein LOC143027569 n=1 Tax=Oratosquilla oratoria TaxID=337810 RepID=UPI003F7768CD